MKHRIAVILHGWPQPEGRQSMYHEYFRQNGYRVISPFLFDERTVFSLQSVRLRVRRLLAGQKPHVIVGISMGGLLSPTLLREYPRVKGVFIASNAKLVNSRSLFYGAVQWANNPVFLRLLGIFRWLPAPVLFEIYQFINQFDGNTGSRAKYLDDIYPFCL